MIIHVEVMIGFYVGCVIDYLPWHRVWLDLFPSEGWRVAVQNIILWGKHHGKFSVLNFFPISFINKNYILTERCFIKKTFQYTFLAHKSWNFWSPVSNFINLAHSFAHVFLVARWSMWPMVLLFEKWMFKTCTCIVCKMFWMIIGWFSWCCTEETLSDKE